MLVFERFIQFNLVGFDRFDAPVFGGDIVGVVPIAAAGVFANGARDDDFIADPPTGDGFRHFDRA